MVTLSIGANCGRVGLERMECGILCCYMVCIPSLERPNPIGRNYRGRKNLEKKEGSVESEVSPYGVTSSGSEPSVTTATASSCG